MLSDSDRGNQSPNNNTVKFHTTPCKRSVCADEASFTWIVGCLELTTWPTLWLGGWIIIWPFGRAGQLTDFYK